VLRSHSDGNRHCVRKMWIEREKKAHPANLKTGKQWYNVRGYVPRIEECPGIQETVLTPVLDRFVDGLASRCPRKESKSKRVNHPTVVTPCKIRAQKKRFKVEFVPLLARTARQMVSTAVASCTEGLCFSSCFGGFLCVGVGSV
jgi:hypothetical protein